MSRDVLYYRGPDRKGPASRLRRRRKRASALLSERNSSDLLSEIHQVIGHMNMMATATTSSTKEEENRLSATAKRFCRRFSLVEIHLATEDFSDAHLIGKGGFGKVYKGIIDNGQVTVAIKRQASNSNQGADEFLMEIETLSKLRHVNLVSLIGYCNENAEMILIYEFMAFGTLADHLYKPPRNNSSEDSLSITWKQRLKICIGAGRGLDYLHTGTSIIHRDVKSTNILLDENLKAKVSDFGLAKHLSTSDSQGHVSTIVKGSFGYLDPSYFTTSKLTRKSDTYAFGVVMLEVLSGRPAVDPGLPEYGGSLVLWAQEKINKGKIDQIVASNLRDKISADCLKTFVGVAKRCLHHDPEKRLTMAQVVAQLQLAFEQQERKASIHNASRFLPFWSRAKLSGNRGSGSTEKDHKQVDVNMLLTSGPTIHEDALKDRQAINILPSSVPCHSIPVDESEDKQTFNVQPIAIPLHDLKDITDNFSSKFFICQGSRELVYRGALKSRQVAAIKKLKYNSWTNQEFLAQVSVLSSLKHDNVTKLLGYCVNGVWQFLVYEFAPNGSLYDILHGWQGAKDLKPAGLTLSWAQRVKIAVGAAKGLEYIHEKGHIHSNIKSNNILLFDDQVGKIDYFGYSTQFSYKGRYEGNSTFGVWLPHGYNPPEYTSPRCVLSWRGDVYSFGVVLLELLTGRKPFDPIQRESLVKWVKPYIKEGKVQCCVDAKLRRDYPPEAAAKMTEVAAMCVKNEAELRPEMRWVVKALCPLLEKGGVKG